MLEKREKETNLRSIPLAIGGMTYHLCVDFEALVLAETHFNFRGQEVNLAGTLLSLTTGTKSAIHDLGHLLPCALHAFQPKLDFLAAQDLMTMANLRSIAEAIGNLWPDETQETEALNKNLCFDFEALADANEFFESKVGLARIFMDKAFRLDDVWRVFPCAAHRFRPELSVADLRRLMTLQSVPLVVCHLAEAYKAASQETMLRFTERVAAVVSDEERQEVLFQLLARKPWPDKSIN